MGRCYADEQIGALLTNGMEMYMWAGDHSFCWHVQRELRFAVGNCFSLGEYFLLGFPFACWLQYQPYLVDWLVCTFMLVTCGDAVFFLCCISGALLYPWRTTLVDNYPDPQSHPQAFVGVV